MVKDLRRLISVAMGRERADLVIKGGKVLSVFTGELVEGDVAVAGGYVAGIGEYEGETTLDASGAVVIPGLIDAHMHLESTLLRPEEFALAVLPHGTTAVVADPHEIANVLGMRGVEYLLEATQGLPVTFYVAVPSCVPAVKGLETYGAELGVEEVAMLLMRDRVVGLAEMMNFPGVIAGDPEVLAKLDAAQGRVLDGHAPGLSGRGLNAYLSTGIGSDHECTSPEEAKEKVRLGMKVMLREGSVAKNLRDLASVVDDFSSTQFMLASDDLLPLDIKGEGHMDVRLRIAVDAGLPAHVAVRMATLNPAQYFRLKERGAVAPGYVADLVVVEDLVGFKVRHVVKEGKVVVEGGEIMVDVRRRPIPEWVRRTVKMPKLSERDLKVEAKGRRCRLIEVVPGQILTKASEWEPPVSDGVALPDPSQDVAKVAVVDRHRGGKRVGLGFVKGFGIKEGAIAGTVGHDAHNALCLGVSDPDMLSALGRLSELQGGLVAVRGGEVLAELPLPIAGLMSDLTFEEVCERLEALYKAARELGVEIEHPFTALSFLPLPVIPELRITDFGLVDVREFRLVDLWMG